VLLIDKRLNEPKRAQNVDTLIPLLADQGLSLPPNKILDTLRTRKAIFVEGTEADYEMFIAALGEILEPGFGIRTRGLKVFETGGAERKWPFDAIDCFQNLLGTELSYVYLSDRDFLTDEEIAARHERARKERRSIFHLERRHRESYLLEPRVLGRLISQQWLIVHKVDGPEEVVSEQSIRSFILARARDLEDSTRDELILQHESSLRGDASHRKEGMNALSSYFRQVYTEPLSRDEIPYRLLDAKSVLKSLRHEMTTRHKVSFSDADICRAFLAEEIPSELQDILRAVLGLFPVPPLSVAAPAKDRPTPEAAVVKPKSSALKRSKPKAQGSRARRKSRAKPRKE
jgi:hypothetical protein